MTQITHYYDVDVVAYAQLTPKTFTYSYRSDNILQSGQLVQVSFGRQKSLGIILNTTQPTEALKAKIRPINTVLEGIILPQSTIELAAWLKNYYATTSRAIWSTILPSGLAAKRRQLISSVPSSSTTTEQELLLSPVQHQALEEIMTTSKPILLSGVTGSGKTHIYKKLIDHFLSQKKSVLYLSPEIFLTQQLAKRLAQHFTHKMVLTHSGLTTTQRRNIWLDCLNNQHPKLYLGPRSSLFLPIRDLGLIIIDEAHDTSYKQENAPRYQAREVAAKLAQLVNAKLIFGSATHNIVLTHLAQLNRLSIVQLTERHNQQKLPDVEIVDIKGLHTPLSPSLFNQLQQCLDRSEQALLLHNKRGSARRLSCEDCGTTISCPRCDTSLVFHADEARLKCHICGYTKFPPSICPACNGNNLYYYGFGTKQLTAEVQKSFPQATIARIDRDQAKTIPLESTLNDAENGKIDILIGTQMIAKGLDFPRVTLVGIIAGDELLFGDDYQSRERGVSLIMQAAGRAGRSKLTGKVIIQTKQPLNPLWRDIKSHNWEAFTTDELNRRKAFHYPPYQYLARINFFAKSPEIAQSDAEEWLRTAPIPNSITTLGPAIPNHAHTNQGYIAHIICKASRRPDLTQLAILLPRNTSYDIDPISIF